MSATTRFQNKSNYIPAFTEKLSEDPRSPSWMALTGWSDENALLVFTRKAQPARPVQAQYYRAERQFYNRLSKPYKEFKFYHYDDPRAYIIQYRRDCSSLSTQSGFRGPLEMFMHSELMRERKLDENIEKKVLTVKRSQNLETNNPSTDLFTEDISKYDATQQGLGWKTGAEKTQHPNRLVPINNTESNANSLSNVIAFTGLNVDCELQETEKHDLDPALTQPTRSLVNAPFSAVERTYQRSQLLIPSSQARRDALSKVIKTSTYYVPSQNKPTDVKIITNPQKSLVNSNRIWDPAVSIRNSSGSIRASTGVNKMKNSKPGKLVGARKKIHPSAGLRPTLPTWPRQSQKQPSICQQVTTNINSGGLVHELCFTEANKVSTDQQASQSKPARIRDGSDPAFGRALYERLLKLECEQNKMDSLGSEPNTHNLPSSIMERSGQISLTSNNAQELERVDNSENAADLLSLTDTQTPI